MDDSEGFTVEEKKTPNSIEVSSYGVYHRNNKIWPTLKPFVNGFLAGQLTLLGYYGAYWSAKLTLYLAEEAHDHHNAAKIRTALHAVRKVKTRLFSWSLVLTQFLSCHFLYPKLQMHKNDKNGLSVCRTRYSILTSKVKSLVCFLLT